MSTPTIPIEFPVLTEAVRSGLSDKGRSQWYPLFPKIIEDGIGVLDQGFIRIVSLYESRFRIVCKLLQDREPLTAINCTTVDRGGVEKCNDIINILKFNFQLNMEECSLLMVVVFHFATFIRRIDVCYGILESMLNQSDWFLYPCKKDHQIRLESFRMMMQHCAPKTTKLLMNIHALSDDHLNQIFVGFFRNILLPAQAHAIMDSYALEGEKTLFRYGLAMLIYLKKDLKSGVHKTAHAFWNALKIKCRANFSDLRMLAFANNSSSSSSLPGMLLRHMSLKQSAVCPSRVILHDIKQKVSNRYLLDVSSSYTSSSSSSISLSLSQSQSQTSSMQQAQLGLHLLKTVVAQATWFTAERHCLAASGILSTVSPGGVSMCVRLLEYMTPVLRTSGTATTPTTTPSDTTADATATTNTTIAVESLSAFKKVFSCSRDGWSLSTLYALAGAQSPCLVLIKASDINSTNNNNAKRDQNNGKEEDSDSQVVIGFFIDCSIGQPDNASRGGRESFCFRLDDAGACRYAAANKLNPDIGTGKTDNKHRSRHRGHSGKLKTSRNNSNNNSNYQSNSESNTQDYDNNLVSTTISSEVESTAAIGLEDIYQRRFVDSNNSLNEVIYDDNLEDVDNLWTSRLKSPHKSNQQQEGVEADDASQYSKSCKNKNNKAADEDGASSIKSGEISSNNKRRPKSSKLTKSFLKQGVIQSVYNQYIRCTHTSLVLGACCGVANTNAIALEYDLSVCRVGRSDTYGNQSLVHPPDQLGGGEGDGDGEQCWSFAVSEVEVYCGPLEDVRPLVVMLNNEFEDDSPLRRKAMVTVNGDSCNESNSTTIAFKNCQLDSTNSNRGQLLSSTSDLHSLLPLGTQHESQSGDDSKAAMASSLFQGAEVAGATAVLTSLESFLGAGSSLLGWTMPLAAAASCSDNIDSTNDKITINDGSAANFFSFQTTQVQQQQQQQHNIAAISRSSPVVLPLQINTVAAPLPHARQSTTRTKLTLDHHVEDEDDDEDNEIEEELANEVPASGEEEDDEAVDEYARIFGCEDDDDDDEGNDDIIADAAPALLHRLLSDASIGCEEDEEAVTGGADDDEGDVMFNYLEMFQAKEAPWKPATRSTPSQPSQQQARLTSPIGMPPQPNTSHDPVPLKKKFTPKTF